MTNELFFIDFEPKVVGKSFWSGKEYEPTSALLERVNEWVRKNYNRRIINVETLMVPTTAYDKEPKGVKKINMHAGVVYMVQVVRVWYQ